MAKVTIETDTLTLSHTSGGQGLVEQWHVVKLVDSLVRALESVEPTNYNIREHLIEALQKP